MKRRLKLLLVEDDASRDFVEISVTGYEFPTVPPDCAEDANWLIVLIRGDSWGALRPCLEGADIRDLAQELASRIAGVDPKVYFHPLQPHLAISITPDDAGEFNLVLRIGSSALPSEFEHPAGGYLTFESTVDRGYLEQVLDRANTILDHYPLRRGSTKTALS